MSKTNAHSTKQSTNPRARSRFADALPHRAASQRPPASGQRPARIRPRSPTPTHRHRLRCKPSAPNVTAPVSPQPRPIAAPRERRAPARHNCASTTPQTPLQAIRAQRHGARVPATTPDRSTPGTPSTSSAQLRQHSAPNSAASHPRPTPRRPCPRNHARSQHPGNAEHQLGRIALATGPAASHRTRTPHTLFPNGSKVPE